MLTSLQLRMLDYNGCGVLKAAPACHVRYSIWMLLKHALCIALEHACKHRMLSLVYIGGLSEPILHKYVWWVFVDDLNDLICILKCSARCVYCVNRCHKLTLLLFVKSNSAIPHT